MHAERSNFRVGVHRLRAATLVVPTGEIDLATRDRFHCSLKPFAGDLVIDLAGVTYMDSSAISVLVEPPRVLCRLTGVCLSLAA